MKTLLSVHQRVADARRVLRDAGLSVAEADLSARMLAEHVLGWSAERYFSDASDPEPDAFADRYSALIARRAAREPLPYITGFREFWGRQFYVTPDVLIPRPETELIVEFALGLYPERMSRIRSVDVGTGSGCLAITIGCERPRAEILATDISEAALRVARRNAAQHGVADRVRFAQGNMLAGIDDTFDLIVANPPYVRSGDRNGLQPEVRAEPDVALYSGEQGLDAIRRLIKEAPPRMHPSGYLVFEFGLGQELDIEQLVDESDLLALVELRRDLQGIPRTAVAKRR
jgi:release factor glutamine methyltransferase